MSLLIKFACYAFEYNATNNLSLSFKTMDKYVCRFVKE